MNAKIAKGTKILYTPTNEEFVLEKVTEKRVSWYADDVYKGGNGINNLTMVWSSIKRFEKGIENGTYKIII